MNSLFQLEAIELVHRPHWGKEFYSKYFLVSRKDGWMVGIDLRSKISKQVCKASEVQDGDTGSYNFFIREG